MFVALRLAKANKLSLNATKSKFMLICSSRNRRQNIRVQLRNVELAQTSFLKYLGVYIDQHLAWNAHITYVSKKISNKCRYSFKFKALSRFKYSQASLLFYSLSLFPVYATSTFPIMHLVISSQTSPPIMANSLFALLEIY